MFFRALIVAVFFIFAGAMQSANASAVHSVNVLSSDELKSEIVQIDDYGSDFHHDDYMPRIYRLSATSFSLETQSVPKYDLVIEFFAETDTERTYNALANPPNFPWWLGYKTSFFHTSRISGWKESNVLYTGKITYHS